MATAPRKAQRAQVENVSRYARIRAALSPSEWRQAGGLLSGVVAIHVLGWGSLLLFTATHPHVKALTLGIGTLAYGFGMRHAFDADHISAIDNTTRKLMADGKRRPMSVGFFFSLGHSTVVLLLSLAIGYFAKTVLGQVQSSSSTLHNFGGLFGTLISGCFLYLIAGLNLMILIGILKIFRRMRAGDYDHEELEHQLNDRGLMYRFFGPVARRIDKPWKMYPLGFLFGLGFDTATEVALLALAGSAAGLGLPFYAIVSLPLIFAAGMSMFDTADGAFMTFAYGWAFAKPVRKVFYNITITGLGVSVALIIGTIELLSVLQSQLNLSGGIWDYAASFDINQAGFIIVGLFVTTWIIALSIWRFGKIEQRWEVKAAVGYPQAIKPQEADVRYSK